MDIGEKEIHAFVNSADKQENKEYLSGVRDKLNKILSELNIKYNEYIHYSIDGKKGKIQYEAVLRQFYAGVINKIYLPDTDQYIDPKILLHSAYIQKDIEKGVITMEIKDSNVSVISDSNVINSSVKQEVHNEVKSINWVEKLPTEDIVTSSQIKEFLVAIKSFMNSDTYKKMTIEEAEPLKLAFSESQKPLQSRKKKWEKLRNFFVNAGSKMPTLINKFAQFIEKNPTLCLWLKELISQTNKM